jgi:N-acyl-D-aspartate/D-glutamate deacylase
VSKHPGTGVEFIPGTGGSFEGVPIDSAINGSTESTSETMIAMSLAARRPLNWNTFHADALNEAETFSRLAAADTAAGKGARVLALMYPGVMYLRHKLMSARWTRVPGWGAMLDMPEAEQAKVLADPHQRAALIVQAMAPGADGSVHPASQWDDVVVNDSHSDVNRRYEGRRLGDLAAELGRGSLDLACEIAVADGMQTGFRRAHIAYDDASWQLRVELWSDPRIVLGASDAGAHVNTISTFDWATAFLELNRTREAMPLEAAVHRITGVQAHLYGLVDRGRVAEGFRADLVVFDADEIGPGRTRMRDDLPGGASRLYSAATGIDHVIVNGVEVARAGELTGEQPGTVLRSGRDTRGTEL